VTYIEAITKIANHKALDNPNVVNQIEITSEMVRRVLQAETLFQEQFDKYLESTK